MSRKRYTAAYIILAFGQPMPKPLCRWCGEERFSMGLEITYLVSNYNKGPYLADCLASLHAQSSSQWRCLICDDGSTDASLAILRPWLGDKVRLIQNERNQGVIYTLSRLIAEAPTDLVGVLDADDALYPETTACLLAAYEQNPAVGFVYSNWTEYSADLRTPLRPGPIVALPPYWTLLTAGFVPAIRTFRVAAYQRTAGLDPAACYAEDMDLTYKLEEVAPVMFIERELYKYRQLPASQSHDPHKTNVMLRSTARVYRNALKRRQIKGRQRLAYELFIMNTYCLRQTYSPQLRRLARWHWPYIQRFMHWAVDHTAQRD